MRDRRRLLIAGIVALVGAVWVGQGLGALGGGFMANDPLWAWVGAALVLLAILYAVWPRLRQR